jgi:cytochrome c biogenesis protein CcmG, thiol:disulfide interchange protein DsbE
MYNTAIILIWVLFAQIGFSQLPGIPIQPSQLDTTFPFKIELTKEDGSKLSSSVFFKPNGKPQLVSVFLTTCMPCIMELNDYSSKYSVWQKEYGLQIVALSTDFESRSERIWSLAKEKKWPFEVIWDKNRLFQHVLPGGLNGLPRMFLYDGKGKLLWKHHGYYTGIEKEFLPYLKKL